MATEFGAKGDVAAGGTTDDIATWDKDGVGIVIRPCIESEASTVCNKPRFETLSSTRDAVLPRWQRGVPTPRVWATQKTMHELRRMERGHTYLKPGLVEDMARYHASALFRSSVAAGVPASLLMCVEQINNEFRQLPGTLTLQNATNFCYMDSSVPRTIAEPSQTYMYFQIMKTNNHSLSQTNDAKCRAHLPRRDLVKIKCEVSVLGGSRHAYAKTDLTVTPHGSEMTTEKVVIDDLLERAGVPQVTVIHGGKMGVVDLSESFGLVVLYSNSRHLKRLPNHLDLEWQLMHYYLATPGCDEHDGARSSGRVGTFLQRKWWGFSQNMPLSYECHRQFNLKTRRVLVNHGRHVGAGVNIPAFSTKMFDHVPFCLQDYLFALMETGQAVLRKHWGGQALNCRSRNHAFSRKLNTQMGRPRLQANFEYYDLRMMRSDDVLLRHMDYKDDTRKNYNHNYVHSFTHTIDGVEYIMIFVMTTRLHVGAVMEHISALSRPLSSN